MWQNSKCDKKNQITTQNLKLLQSLKTQIVTTLKAQNLKFWQKLKTQIVTTLKNSNCGKIQTPELGQN